MVWLNISPMLHPKNKASWLAVLPYAIGILAIHYFVERHEGWPLMLLYGLAFTAFAYLVNAQHSTTFSLITGLAIRIALLWGLPTLSDDFYRFVWDGHLLSNGISPFAQLPSWYMDAANATQSAPTHLYEYLNSKEYFTIYPPLAQAIFWLSAKLSSTLVGAVLVMRLVIIAVDVLNFFLLKNLLVTANKPTSKVSWYFLNPLVVLELTGNLHFEGLVLAGILLMLYFYGKNQQMMTGAGLAIGIAAKLTPLMLLPAMALRGQISARLKFFAGVGVVVALCFVPMLDTHLINGLGESLGLFVSKFEFNGSIYLIIRRIGYWYRGYNIIGSLGPALTWATVVAVSGLALATRKWQSLADVFILTYFVYLALALVVHPWYIIPLVGLSMVGNFRMPIVWSAVIFLTYWGYSSTGYDHPYWLISVEYLLVYGVLGWEIWRKYKESKQVS